MTKNAGGIDRRTIAIAILVIAGLGAVGPLAVSQGVALDQGIYRVGVAEESPYYEPVLYDPTFQVQDPSPGAVEAGNQELWISGTRVRNYTESPKGRAAVSELRSTSKRYNDGLMAAEDNRTAAFPVVVNVTYVQRDVTRVVVPDTLETDAGPDEEEPDEDAGAGDGAVDGGGSDGDDRSDDSDGPDGAVDDDPAADPEDSVDGAEESAAAATSAGENVAGGIGQRLTGGGVSGTPSDITPPFPFGSLVLAFVFVLPLNFVIQAYGSTMLSERINRRGELLLVSPVTRTDVIAGKTLPYLAGSLAVAALITAVLGGSHVSVLAVTPLALLFLSATFLGAMFARSFKELTFVTVTITVSLTSYAFVPAIFTDVTPIALISPLTLVVRDLQGQAIGLGEFAFSTVPPTLTALVLFALGAGLYREEDMFTQRPIPLKVLDALAGRIHRHRSVALVSALLVPFVFVAELVAIALLFALGEISIPLVLVAVAVIEELGKSLHVYAGYAHAKFDRRLRTALWIGALSGLGFFVAEKFTVITQLADLPDLEIGEAALNTGLVSIAPGYLTVALLFAPLALHVVTATISTVGARRGRRAYAAALALAIGVHVAYNLTAVSVLVG